MWLRVFEERRQERKKKRGFGGRRRKLACLCCDPSFFFLPCLLEGTKERQCQDVESISPSSGHRAALPGSHHKENINLIYRTCLKHSLQALHALRSYKIG